MSEVRLLRALGPHRQVSVSASIRRRGEVTTASVRKSPLFQKPTNSGRKFRNPKSGSGHKKVYLPTDGYPLRFTKVLLLTQIDRYLCMA
jgi:hypothetical protein